MYESWYDHINSTYQEKANLCCMDTDSFIVTITIEDVYEYIANDTEKDLTHEIIKLKDHYQ